MAALTRMLPSHLMVENRSVGAGPEWDCSVMRPGDIGSSARRRYARRPGFSLFNDQPDLLAKSVACSLAILARLACADVNAQPIVHLYFDRLVTAVTANVEAHVVAALFQLADDFVRNPALDFNVTAFFHFFAGRFVIAFVLPPGSIACFLYIQSKIDLVGQNLDMSLWLHPAAHHTKRFPRFAVFHHKTGNDGMKWTLAWRVNVGVALLH